MIKYQLWDMVSYGHGEPMVPFTLLDESSSFEHIYGKFIKQKNPTVIFVKNNKKNIEVDPTVKIYESPDGGKTVYSRDFGDYNNREKIK